MVVFVPQKLLRASLIEQERVDFKNAPRCHGYRHVGVFVGATRICSEAQFLNFGRHAFFDCSEVEGGQM